MPEDFTLEDSKKVINDFIAAVDDYKQGSLDLTAFTTRCMVIAEDAQNYGLKDWE